MVHNEITVVITARGEGTRMKGLSPLPKHMLYFGGKRIIDCIRDCFEGFNVVVLDGPPTKSRAETLEELRGMQNVLIVDCDIIPDKKKICFSALLEPEDLIFFFKSQESKYGGLYMDGNSRLLEVTEKGDAATNYRSSGVYILRDVGATIDRMTDPNSIASGMIGARMIRENTFIRVGDTEDYLKALK